MKGVEHIGIAVSNLDEAEVKFAKLLGVNSYKREEVDSEGVITSFFKVGDVKIELLAATRKDSPIQKFIDKRGEGIHHIAFGVKDCDTSLENKISEGFIPISAKAKIGADNKNIAFLHPKSVHGVLVEMCSERT
jgi:methylmalonyl-CoA/ethylmalonyl-CoA epimerase